LFAIELVVVVDQQLYGVQLGFVVFDYFGWLLEDFVV